MSENALPKHIGFIMDGNGRWAAERGKKRSFGHKAGYDTLVSIIDYAFEEKDIKALSFYAFSTENWARPKEEVDKLMSLMAKALKSSAPKLIKKKIRFIISGDYSVVKPGVKRLIDELIEKTKNFSEHTLNICFNYGGRQDIVHAVNSLLAEGVKSVDENMFSNYLYTSLINDPDLIIRTSGEQRLSNFLLWQVAYSELYFTDVYWPDFNCNAFDSALEWYSNRKRRFGKAN